MHEKWPDFLIIGAEKAGTTSLYYYLQQHPKLFLSREKEPRFFGLNGLEKVYRGPNDPDANLDFATEEAYLDLFQHCPSDKIAGEGSTMYLYSRQAPAAIYDKIPDVRLIAILRNPVERAYSNFLYALRDGWETIHDFHEALGAEARREKQGWGPRWQYKRKGLYGEQITRYLEMFHRSQILLLRYEDYRCDPIVVCQQIFSFLQVDDGFRPNIGIRYNISGIPRNALIHQLLNRDNNKKKRLKTLVPSALRTRIKYFINRYNIKRKGVGVPPLTREIKKYLVQYYDKDITLLESITEWDLSDWRNFDA